jgi:broad specificity phosphatase PhoE
MRIFLIRHGESITNTGENYVNRIPDHLVSLTERGVAQARENGTRIADISTRIDGNRFLGIPIDICRILCYNMDNDTRQGEIGGNA